MAEDTAQENKVLKMERTFEAPRDLVWDAWTKPEMLSQWWSPDTFSVPVCELDVRPEGKMHIEMQGPDGTRYPMNAEYEVVERPGKLVFNSRVLDNSGNEVFRVHHTVIFNEEGDKTKLNMIWEVTHQTPEAEKYLSGMEQGLTQSLEKLKAVLSK